MPKSRNTTGNSFNLPSVDDLFRPAGSPAEEKSPAGGVMQIPISEIADFPDHPFKVRNDSDMQKLVESVSEYGVLEPALVRPRAEGGYEMIAGHRRKMASALAGRTEIPCIIREVTDDEATIIMVDSNLQREEILPSEKAFAYKMKLDAMKRQGKRTDLTSDPLEPKSAEPRSNEKLSAETGDSASQIKRYIRLTYLIPGLLNLVDEGRIKMRPAVELSYLTKEEQQSVLESIQAYDCTPSHAQTITMRRASEEGKLDPDMIEDIMSEEKPNQKERITLNSERVRKYIPRNVSVPDTEKYIIEALEFYKRYKEKQAAKAHEAERQR